MTESFSILALGGGAFFALPRGLGALPDGTRRAATTAAAAAVTDVVIAIFRSQ